MIKPGVTQEFKDAMDSLELWDTYNTYIGTMNEKRDKVLSLLKPKDPRGCDCNGCVCDSLHSAVQVAVWDTHFELYNDALKIYFGDDDGL